MWRGKGDVMNRYNKYSKSEKGRARLKTYKAKNKEKVSAQNKALYLYERDWCSVEGCEALGERHHPNYSRPDIIIWLCRKHHKALHSPRQKCMMMNYGKKCNLPAHAKGFCKKHYARLYRKRQGW
jgi:hypothetical protein